MAENKLRFKMLIDRKENKVLFAEAGKEFVDFLFHLLSLPVGTIIRLLKCPNMVGSFGNLYKSLESLNNDYVVLANRRNNLLLNPDNVVTGVPFLLPENSQCPVRKTFYRCLNHCNHNYVTDKPNTSCPGCHNSMNVQMTYVSTFSEMLDSFTEKGVVKRSAIYMVMDDLTITPMSMISGIALLNKRNIKDFGALEERMVEFGINEALGILRGALQSKTTLTDVFLVKQEH